MPAKKKDKDTPAAAPKNPATAAHERDMDEAVEAKRSGPPAAETRGPKPMADPDAGVDHPDQPAPVSEAEGEKNSQTIADIEAKLKDPTFDPEGKERLKLAEESRSLPSGPHPVTSDVDEHGNPMEPKR